VLIFPRERGTLRGRFEREAGSPVRRLGCELIERDTFAAKSEARLSVSEFTEG